MQTQQMPLLSFLATPNVQFAIPIFQRVYSWTERECADFFDDAYRAGAADETHFMGIVLHSIDPEGWRGFDQIDIIDGQQRLTTLSILMSVIAARLKETGSELDGMDADALRETYLVLQGKDSVEGKLALTYLDRYTLFALACAIEIPEEHAPRVIDNRDYFARRIAEDGFDLATLWRGLKNLTIISTRLTGDDAPQLVFESLNSKGMPLSVGDLVSNQLLMSGDTEEQMRLFTQYWKPIEDLVDSQDETQFDISAIITAWLADKYRDIHINGESEVYGIFKDHLRDGHAGSFESLLKDLLGYAQRYATDVAFRAAANHNAEDWVGGKPVKLVSELKLFGD